MSVIDLPTENLRLTREGAASYLGVSEATLATWATRGGGPPFLKIGRKVVYLQRDLDAWMQSRRITCTTELSGAE